LTPAHCCCTASVCPSSGIHEGAPVYGSGGFTSYGDRTLAGQLAGWVEAGIPRVTITVGRDPRADPHRLAVARQAVGDDVELFVDANGAWTRKQAIEQAQRWGSAGWRSR
jgi:L-alanine-DL-glutamate epimerase-like enolase superfamily enzyme